MKLASLFSGGKDSLFALLKAQEHHDVVCLVSIRSANKESYMFHVPNIDITSLQSEAMGIPLILWETRGEKEVEIQDLEAALEEAKKKYAIDGVVTGAVASVYQATRIQQVCAKLHLHCFNPLWLMDQEELLHQIVDANVKAHIAAIAAYPLSQDLLGKEIDAQLVDQLLELRDKYEINPAGEGGEIETIVLNAPNFKKRIVPIKTHVEGEKHAATWVIDEANLQ